MADGKPTAVNAPGVDRKRIDIGWDRPVSMQEIAQIAERRLGQQIRVRSPSRVDQYCWGGGGSVQPMVKDRTAMMRWFRTGRYVADPTRQGDVVWRGRSWSEVFSVPDVGRLTGGNVSPAPSRIFIFRSGMPTSHRRTPHRK